MAANALPGCATPPSDPAERAVFEQNNDPLEPLNRKILDVNLFLDRILIKPVAKVYVAVLPEYGRDAIHRVLDNMKEPIVCSSTTCCRANSSAPASRSARFAVNTTLGLGGMFDVATGLGAEAPARRFRPDAVRLGACRSGPYLILPLLGPSNPRDAIGMGIDSYVDPFTILADAHGARRI